MRLLYLNHIILCIYIFVGLANMCGASRGYSLAEHNLAKVIQEQFAFFEFAKDCTSDQELELTRKAQSVVTAYESHLVENPNDVNGLILFGKFLKKVGQNQRAIDYFLKADVLEPKLAVIKQQIANYLVESGKALDAFPFFLMATQLNPEVANYHFELGNYIYIFSSELTEEGILKGETAPALLFQSFKAAADIAPENFEYRLRFAQSFFDYPHSEKLEALDEWNSILSNFPDLSKAEKDYIRLCKARVLIELNRKLEAKKLIHSVSSKSLSKSKVSLLKQASSTKSKELPAKPSPLPPKAGHKTGFLFPTDKHLQRMHSVFTRLSEEKLLSELTLDVLKARLDDTGQVQLEFLSEITKESAQE